MGGQSRVAFMGANPGGIRLLCRKGIFKLLKDGLGKADSR